MGSDPQNYNNYYIDIIIRSHGWPRTVGHDPLKLNVNQHGQPPSRGEMNAGLIILRVASERREAQNERDGAGAAQLRRSSSSVPAAAS